MAQLDLALTRAERVSEANPNEWDLFVDPNTGDLLTLDNVDTEVQEIRLRIQTIEGEVYEKPDAGIPWFSYVLGNKQANPAVVKGFLRREILVRGSVVQVTKLEYTFDGASRAATIAFEGLLADGQVLGDEYTRGVL